MLKLHLLNEIKFFPFESKEEAQKRFDLMKLDPANSFIVKVIPTCIDEYSETYPLNDLFIIAHNKGDKPKGFYDADGYTYFTSEQNFYTKF